MSQQNLWACLNKETYYTKNDILLYEDDHTREQVDLFPYGHNIRNAAYYLPIIEELYKVYDETKDLDYLSDVGYIYILIGRYQEAINLYLEIEEKEPDRYSTASNIGTTYELIGENEKALYWIKKSVQIDPNSHWDSEWLHIKILEAKIKGEQYITSDFLLGTNFGKGAKPTSELPKDSLINLMYSISYQLNERVTFIKGENKIVAQLLFDLANVFTILNQYPYDNPVKTFELSKEYGFDDPIIQKRINYIIEIQEKAESDNKLHNRVVKSVTKVSENNPSLFYSLTFGTLTLFILLVIIKLRKKK